MGVVQLICLLFSCIVARGRYYWISNISLEMEIMNYDMYSAACSFSGDNEYIFGSSDSWQLTPRKHGDSRDQLLQDNETAVTITTPFDSRSSQQKSGVSHYMANWADFAFSSLPESDPPIAGSGTTIMSETRNRASAHFLSSPSQSFVNCFSSENTVIVKGKGEIPMGDLEVGDNVMTAKGKYKKVYANLYLDRYKPTEYLQIQTTLQENEGNHKPLELSAKHMLFLEDRACPIPARKVKVGDVVQTIHGPQEVTDIQTITRNGLYNPVTVDGTIVVNGIVASTYSTALKNDAIEKDEDSTTTRANDEYIEIAGYTFMSQQTFSEVAYAPYQFICIGISRNICKVYDDVHDPLYNQLGRHLSSFWHQQHSAIQLLLFVIFTSVFGAAYSLTILTTNISSIEQSYFSCCTFLFFFFVMLQILDPTQRKILYRLLFEVETEQ